jgi:hypothetical protein
MPKATLKLNVAGFRELRRSPAVLADLLARGKRVASAAGDGYQAQPWTGRNRARVVVRTATDKARASEARTHKLLGALDAGR